MTPHVINDGLEYNRKLKRRFITILGPLQSLKNKLWKILIYTCILYNFHRYIFKYSHGGYPKEGYQQTPIGWQVGKFIFIGVTLLLMYCFSSFNKKIKKSIVIFYFFILIILIINLLSGILYGSLLTDEIEYCLYAIMLFPFGVLSKAELEILAYEFNKSIWGCQLILVVSNWIVIYNYFANNILPFHAYEGVLLRFGGFWDDPNTLAIFSVFLFGYAVINKQYVWATFNVVNILLAISFGGYILLFAISAYLLLKSSIKRVVKILIISSLFFVLSFLILYNSDLIMAIYEAKRQSVLEHTTVDLHASLVPLANPIQFHETWFISLNINYFPFSIIIDIFIIYLLVRAINSKVVNLQHVLVIIFFLSNMFLPFLYMFPINFVSLILLLFYLREVYL